MKKMGYILVIIVIGVYCVSGASTAFAYGDGGGATDDFGSAGGSGIKYTGSCENASSGVTASPPRGPVRVTSQDIADAQAALEGWQTVETAGDIATFGAQMGVYGYAIYAVKTGAQVVLIPISIVWHVSKHTSRITYGLITGRMGTVYQVNERTFTGRIANWAIVQHLK